MKRTDLDRRERDIKKAAKKEMRQLKGGGSDRSVGDFINDLAALFFHDGTKIYNIDSDEKILEILEEMQMDVPEKQWDNVIRKAVKKTGVSEREPAVQGLKALLDL